MFDQSIWLGYKTQVACIASTLGARASRPSRREEATKQSFKRVFVMLVFMFCMGRAINGEFDPLLLWPRIFCTIFFESPYYIFEQTYATFNDQKV